MSTLKPQSNGPLYCSNTVIGTLAVDGWAVTFGTARRGLGGLRPPAHSPPRCTRYNGPAVNGQCIATLYYSMCHCEGLMWYV